MPAETHQHREAVTSEDIVGLLVAVLSASIEGDAADGDVADCDAVGRDTALTDLGIDSDLGLFDLGDLVAEEYGERSLGDVDLDELRGARTVLALAQVFARYWSGPDEGEEPKREPNGGVDSL